MYPPDALNAGDVVYVQAPAEHGALPACVAMPVIETPTAPSPLVHAPPIDVTVAFVRNGNVTVALLTFVTLTTGAVVSIVNVITALDPTLPAASVWDVVTV